MYEGGIMNLGWIFERHFICVLNQRHFDQPHVPEMLIWVLDSRDDEEKKRVRDTIVWEALVMYLRLRDSVQYLR